MTWRVSLGPRWSYIIGSMALQDPDNWKFPLTQLSEVPIQLSQPSTSRRHLKDEEEPSKHHV